MEEEVKLAWKERNEILPVRMPCHSCCWCLVHAAHSHTHTHTTSITVIFTIPNMCIWYSLRAIRMQWMRSGCCFINIKCIHIFPSTTIFFSISVSLSSCNYTLCSTVRLLFNGCRFIFYYPTYCCSCCCNFLSPFFFVFNFDAMLMGHALLMAQFRVVPNEYCTPNSRLRAQCTVQAKERKRRVVHGGTVVDAPSSEHW